MIDTKLVLERKSREIYAYLLCLLKASLPPQKFVIFAQGRTGSQLLCSLLNCHPDIHCDLEILRVVKVFFPELYVRGRCARVKTPVYGFKFKIYHLTKDQNIDPQIFLLSLHKQGWKIIHLTRLNLMRQAISVLVADSRKEWHYTSKNTVSNSKIYIDCDKLIKLMQHREFYLEEEKKILKDLPYLPLVYEENLLSQDKHQPTLNKIFDYLEIPSIPVKSRLVKTTSAKMSNFIQNYEELIDRVSQTKYAKFLED